MNELRIIALKHLSRASRDYPETGEEIRAWMTIVKASRWRNFIEAKDRFPDADCIDGYAVFNFGWNRYRLVTVIHYAKARVQEHNDGRVYIRSFLTHKQYDNRRNWDRRYGQ